MKKISVIVPVYNVEKYLKESLDSLINQTYSNLEIILIDDGSKDKSGVICDEYASRDNRIKVIHQKNQGASIAKNKGLDVMTGDYFTFVDSDDWIDIIMIEKMVESIKKNKVDIVECNIIEEYIEFSDKRVFHSEEKIYTNIEYLSLYPTMWSCSLMTNKLFNSCLTDNIRFKYERRCIDDEFYTYKVVANAKRIATISGCYYHYRKRKGSAVNNEKLLYQKNNDKILYVKERCEFILKKYNCLSRLYKEYFINMLLLISEEEYLLKVDYEFIKKELLKFFIRNFYDINCLKYFKSIFFLIFTSYNDRPTTIENSQKLYKLFE